MKFWIPSLLPFAKLTIEHILIITAQTYFPILIDLFILYDLYVKSSAKTVFIKSTLLRVYTI